MSTLLYGIKQGMKSIIQNKIFSLAAIGTITACLFLLGVFYALFSNFGHMVYNAESAVSITVFFDEGISQERIDAIGTDITNAKGVEKVEYISPETAWERFKKDNLQDSQELLETFGNDNPLYSSASFEVYLNDISQQETLAEHIKTLEGVRKVNGSNTTANSMSSFNRLVAYVTITIIVLLILVSVFLISSAVAMGISVRKDEIAIMKLIGATDVFVRLPFMIEGITMGMVGAVIPLLLLHFMYERVTGFIVSHFESLSPWLTFLTTKEVFATLIPLSMGVGIGIGLLGSAMSVRKHLQV